MKSVEQKLYEALRDARGVRLSADEVERLVFADEAIGARITNAACDEAGIVPTGCDAVPRSDAPTWRHFQRLLAHD